MLGREASARLPGPWADIYIQLPTVMICRSCIARTEVRVKISDPVGSKMDRIVGHAAACEPILGNDVACDRRCWICTALPGSDEVWRCTGELIVSVSAGYAFADRLSSACTRLTSAASGTRFDFRFQVVPQAKGRRRGGLRVTSRWPFKVDENPAELAVQTERAGRRGLSEVFGNDWFSLGFQAEIGEG